MKENSRFPEYNRFFFFRLVHWLLSEMQNVEEISLKSSDVAVWEILPNCAVTEFWHTAKTYKQLTVLGRCLVPVTHFDFHLKKP